MAGTQMRKYYTCLEGKLATTDLRPYKTFSGDEAQRLHVLCEACHVACRELLALTQRNGPIRYQQWQSRVLYSSSEELEESAKLGCHFCTLLHHQLSGNGSYKHEVYKSERRQGVSVTVIPPFKVPKDVNPITYPGNVVHLRASFQSANNEDAECIDRKIHLKAGPKDLDDLYNNADEALWTGSQSHMELIAKWTTNCHSNHPKCDTYGKKVLPSRLLFIEGDDDDFQTVRLHNVGIDDERIKYCTLSYCWGGLGDFINLQANDESMQRLHRGVPVRDLPQLFQDAIKVTTTLGATYLWIDALCIVQGSNQDWQQESIKMGDIYTNSLCTIAAAKASNPSESLFVKRNPHLEQQCIIAAEKYGVLSVLGNNALPKYTIDKRGWCMQETMLSRCVIFFGQQVNFVCNSAYLEEFRFNCSDRYRRGGQGQISAASDSIPAYGVYYRPPLFNVDNASDTVYIREWSTLVTLYTGRDLGKQSDRLIALSGIANHLCKRYPQAEYVAGLWVHQISRALLWKVRSVPEQRCVPYQAPTWSWASINARVSYDFTLVRTISETLFSLRESWVKTDDNDTFRTGRVFDAYLKVLGSLVPARPQKGERDGNTIEFRLHEEGRPNKIKVYFDCWPFLETTEVDEEPASVPESALLSHGPLDPVGLYFFWPVRSLLMSKNDEKASWGKRLFGRDNITYLRFEGLMLRRKEGYYERVGLAEFYPFHGRRDFASLLMEDYMNRWSGTEFEIR